VSSARRCCAGVLTGALRREVADLTRVTARPVVLSGFPLSLAFLVDRRALSLDLRALPGDPAERHDPPSPGPSRARIMPEGVPLQSLSRPPGGPTVWRSAPAPRGSLALRRRPSLGPRMRRPRFPGSATVPTPGFLTPSSVSWLDRACGFVAPRCRPWASFSLQSVPLASGRVPLVGAAGSLAVLPGRTPVRRARSCHLWPSPTRATFGRRPWPDPAEARGSLSASLLAPTHHLSAAADAPRGASRSPWTSHAGLTSVRPFRRLRSVLPCASPFTPRGGSPSRGGRCSPGRPRPSRALLPPDLGPSIHPPRPEASLLPLAPRASRRVVRPPGLPCVRACSWLAPRVPRCWEPSTSGGLERGRPNRPARPVGGHRIPTTRAVPPFGSSLDSHDLGCPSELEPVHVPATWDRGHETQQV